jgi:hypothetical protein
MNAAAVLAWLDRHARQILIQDISPKRRQKNRCILQYLPPDSTSLEVVGSHSIETAVLRAHARISARKDAA